MLPDGLRHTTEILLPKVEFELLAFGHQAYRLADTTRNLPGLTGVLRYTRDSMSEELPNPILSEPEVVEPIGEGAPVGVSVPPGRRAARRDDGGARRRAEGRHQSSRPRYSRAAAVVRRRCGIGGFRSDLADYTATSEAHPLLAITETWFRPGLSRCALGAEDPFRHPGAS